MGARSPFPTDGSSPDARPVAKKPARTRPSRRASPPSASVEPAFTTAKDEMVEEQIKAATDQAEAQANAMFNDAGTRAHDAMERGSKLFAEMGDLGRGNLDAMAESGRIAARGLESMGQDAAAQARRSYESGVSALRTLTAAKSPTELFQAQGELVRQSFDAMVSVASRSTEATLKLAGDVAQPLQNRWAITAEKVRTAA